MFIGLLSISFSLVYKVDRSGTRNGGSGRVTGKPTERKERGVCVYVCGVPVPWHQL